VVSNDAVDADRPAQRLVAHVRECDEKVIRVEFDLGKPVPAPPAPWGAVTIVGLSPQ